MTAPAELADELAIRDLLYRYARGVDRRDVDLVRSCFAPDARYDGALATGTIADMLAALPRAMQRYMATMHFMSTPIVTIDGDRARCVTVTAAYHVLHEPRGNLRVIGVRYEDRLVRHADHWRIEARRVHRLFQATS